MPNGALVFLFENNDFGQNMHIISRIKSKGPVGQVNNFFRLAFSFEKMKG